MRFLKVSFAIGGIYILFFVGFSPLSGCKKDVVHDTTVKIVRDTTIVHDSIYDLRDGLVAYFDFNAGSLNDASGYSNNIVFNNAISTTDRFGHANNAYSFNGADNYMKVLHSSTLNLDNITIFAIVKVNGFSNADCHINSIVSKGTPESSKGFISLRVQDQFPCAQPIDSAHEFFFGIF